MHKYDQYFKLYLYTFVSSFYMAYFLIAKHVAAKHHISYGILSYSRIVNCFMYLLYKQV